MTTQSNWQLVEGAESPITQNYVIILYQINCKRPYDEIDREIIFNDDETLTIESQFPQLIGWEKQAKKYADNHGLSYQSSLKIDEKSTTFKPFHVVYLLKKNGHKTLWKTTGVYVEQLKAKIDQVETPITLDQLKDISLLNIKTHKELIDLKYWNNNWTVKFALQPKLVKNIQTKELKLNVNCLQLVFSNKHIDKKWAQLTQLRFNQKMSRDPFMNLFN